VDLYKVDQYSLGLKLKQQIVQENLRPGYLLHLLDRKRKGHEEIENIDIENQV